MSGPPPKDPSQRRRRNATPGFEQLPAEGRALPAPKWPFDEPTKREQQMWDELWRLPQAIKWEEMNAEDTVALYVRCYVEAMQERNPKMLNEVRQLDSKLGISPKAMRDMRWEVEAVKVIEEDPRASAKTERVYVPPS
jgi:hypothetical protein